jgi:hypothetical protein
MLSCSSLGLQQTGILPTPSVAHAAIALLPQGNTGIAAQYPGDVNIRSNPNVLFTDDFESYSFASQLTTNWDSYYQAGNTRITTESGNVFAGSRSLEFTQPQGRTEVANEILKNISPTQDTLFVRVYTKFSSGFSVTVPGHNGIRIQARYPDRETFPTVATSSRSRSRTAHTTMKRSRAIPTSMRTIPHNDPFGETTSMPTAKYSPSIPYRETSAPPLCLMQTSLRRPTNGTAMS